MGEGGRKGDRKGRRGKREGEGEREREKGWDGMRKGEKNGRAMPQHVQSAFEQAEKQSTHYKTLPHIICID